MQIFLTIISGVAVYILGQIIVEFVLKPIKTFNEQRTDTSFLVLFNQAKITNASNTDPKIQDELKEMPAALIAYMRQIPFYRFFAWLRIFGLPHESEVMEAARELNGVVYGMGPVGSNEDSPINNVRALEKIARLLRIKTAYS